MAKKEEGKKRAQAREKEERLEARREVHTLATNTLNLSTCLRFSNGECLRSRPPRTPQKLKRRTVAWHNVRPIPVFLLPFFSSFPRDRQLIWVVKKTPLQTSNRTKNHGPASHRQRLISNASASTSTRMRNSSRPSPSWRTLTRARPFTMLPLTTRSTRRSDVPCRHRRRIRRAGRRRGVGRTVARRRRCGTRPRRREERLERRSARGGQKRRNGRAERRRGRGWAGRISQERESEVRLSVCLFVRLSIDHCTPY